MELIEVECTCKTCKNIFIVKKECHNKLEAEQQAARIQRRRNPICPACYKKEQDQNAIMRATELGLPEIIGRTEKQIAFAFSLRNSYVSRHKGEILRAQRELERINPLKVSDVAGKRGMDEEECVVEAFERLGLYKAYACVAEINAQRLIDIFRDDGPSKKR